MRVIMTRPAAQAGPWLQALRQALGPDGPTLLSLPLIAILPPPDPQALQQAWQRLEGLALVFFVSGNAVQHFFAHRPPGQAWPAATLAAAPGPGTAQALRDQGVPPDCVLTPAEDAAQFDSEAVWALLADRPWTGREVLVLRGEAGRDWLSEQLLSAGARLSYLTTYRRRPPEPDAAGLALLQAAMAAPQQHLWCFSSSEAVRQLQALAPQACMGAPALVTHPRIAQAARAAGCTPVQTCAPALAAVSQALRDMLAGLAQRPDGPGTPPAQGASVQSRTL